MGAQAALFYENKNQLFDDMHIIRLSETSLVKSINSKETKSQSLLAITFEVNYFLKFLETSFLSHSI